MRITKWSSALLSIGTALLAASMPIYADSTKIHVYNATNRCICDGLLSCKPVTNSDSTSVVIEAIGRDLDTTQNQASWHSITPGLQKEINSEDGGVSARVQGNKEIFSVPGDTGYSNFTAILMADQPANILTDEPASYFLTLMPTSFINVNTCKVNDNGFDNNHRLHSA